MAKQKRIKKKKQSALDRMIEHHKKSCTYFVFSGDRHCSCGRDEAEIELADLRKRAAPPEPFTEQS